MQKNSLRGILSYDLSTVHVLSTPFGAETLPPKVHLSPMRVLVEPSQQYGQTDIQMPLRGDDQ